MEHRNSTVMTSSGSLGRDRGDLLDTVSHEFFHSWNVERIRPQSLEPFDLERANMSAELWLAEGFTQYYGRLTLSRTGIADLQTTAATLAGFVTSVALNPAHLVRSAEDMSRMAPFTDGARPIDRTNWSNTVTSYYQFGGALALALDLTLRDRSNGQVTLDDYMRAMWRVHGKPGGTREGYVDRPYTSADAEARLAEVTNDAAFARDFFGRYVRGHDVPDYARLLSDAGFVLRKQHAGRAWWGDLGLDSGRGGIRVTSPAALDAPIYRAGLDAGDEVRQVDGVRMATVEDVVQVAPAGHNRDAVVVVAADRSGAERTVTVTLAEDPSLEMVPVEGAGGTLTAAQKTFRDRWLNAKP